MSQENSISKRAIPFNEKTNTYDRAKAKIYGITDEQLIKAETILKIIFRLEGVLPQNVIGVSREGIIILVRRIYTVFLCRELQLHPKIARLLLTGKKDGESKDRVSMLHALKAHDDLIDVKDKKYVSLFENIYQAFFNKEVIIEKEETLVILSDDDVVEYFFNADEIEKILLFNNVTSIPPKVKGRLQKSFTLKELKDMCMRHHIEKPVIHAGLMRNPKFFLDKIAESNSAKAA